jgi:hypothetical protein
MTVVSHVPLKSTFLSKINWTQLIAVVAMLLTTFGIDLQPEVQAQIVSLIVALQAVATWVLKTWFASTITPASAVRAGMM